MLRDDEDQGLATADNERRFGVRLDDGSVITHTDRFLTLREAHSTVEIYGGEVVDLAEKSA